MNSHLSRFIATALVATAVSASANPVHTNLVTKKGLIVGNIDNSRDITMHLVSTDVIHGTVKAIEVPSEIAGYDTAVYKLALGANSQVRLTYTDDNGYGCRITFSLSDIPNRFIEHDIDEIENHSYCHDDWDTDNFNMGIVG